MRSNADTSGSISLASALGAGWLTTALSANARAALVTLGRIETVPTGSALTREGELADDCAIVLEGRVALRMRVPERGMVTILTVEPGDLVGWSAVVPPYRATSTAIAVGPATLAMFDGSRLRDELARNTELAASFYPLVLTAVGRRLEGTRLQLLDLFGQRWVEPW
jgi:CRP/FNR family transcriptional regulator, cyclic AMP receptor protein